MARRPEHVRDVASAAGLGVVAALYLLASRHYPLDSLATPGPGVFPLAVGLLALTLAAAQAVRALVLARRASSAPAAAGRGVAPSEDVDASSRRAFAMLALLVGCAAAIGELGFLPVSFVLALGASRILGARGWLGPGALAFGVTLAAWLIFVRWLGVPLPMGLFR
jgi:Tripartite tricarboxylate transporter TctB family